MLLLSKLGGGGGVCLINSLSPGRKTYILDPIKELEVIEFYKFQQNVSILRSCY